MVGRSIFQLPLSCVSPESALRSRVCNRPSTPKTIRGATPTFRVQAAEMEEEESMLHMAVFEPGPPRRPGEGRQLGGARQMRTFTSRPSDKRHAGNDVYSSQPRREATE
jgi:hypothetical protein